MLLKNGTKERSELVLSVMTILESMFKDHPIVFMEFVELCRNPHHQVFGDVLEQYSELISIGDTKYHVHERVRNIVLSAVSGEGWTMCLGNPVKN